MFHVRSIFIILSVCVIVGVCLWSIVLLILEYLEKHQVTTFKLDYTANQPFPAITICLERQTKALQIYNEDVLKNCGIGEWVLVLEPTAILNSIFVLHISVRVPILLDQEQNTIVMEIGPLPIVLIQQLYLSLWWCNHMILLKTLHMDFMTNQHLEQWL